MIDFDIQASPKCLELIGWEKLKEFAKGLVATTPDLEWYPYEWFSGTEEQKANCPEQIKISFIEWMGAVMMVLPYVDENGIRVMSFDPGRKDIPDDFRLNIKDGHHRQRGI